MIDADAIKAIEAILSHGNDVQIQRKADGIVVLEIARKIKYKCSQNVAKRASI